MLKIIVGVARKVGLPHYGSLGATCTIESEAESTLLDDPERFHQKLRSAYAAAWEAVEEQLMQRSSSPSVDSVGTDAALTGQPATPRQIEYAHKLADQISDIGSARLSSFAEDTFGKSVQALSCSDASRLIDMLRQIRAGKAPGYSSAHAA